MATISQVLVGILCYQQAAFSTMLNIRNNSQVSSCHLGFALPNSLHGGPSLGSRCCLSSPNKGDIYKKTCPNPVNSL